MIALAGPEHAEAVHALAQAAFGIYVADMGRRPMPMDADYGALISRGAVHVSLGEDGELDGFVVFYPLDGEMFLDAVAVRAQMRSKGLGRALIGFAERTARQAGFSTIRLITNVKMTANLSLYPSLGYAEIGRDEADGRRWAIFRKRLG